MKNFALCVLLLTTACDGQIDLAEEASDAADLRCRKRCSRPSECRCPSPADLAEPREPTSPPDLARSDDPPSIADLAAARDMAQSAPDMAQPPPSGTTTPLFRMDYSAAAGLVGGWTDRRAPNANYTLSRQAGIGPDGQDVYRLAMDHVGPNGGDYYWGHYRRFTGAPFAYGDRVYFRWRYKWLPNTDCRAYQQGGTGALAGIYRNKILIVNDASSSATSRFIMTVECEPSPLRYYWRLQKGGGVDPAQTPYYSTFGTWIDVQVELQYSTAPGVANGAYRVWINNNVMGAPSAERTGIMLNADVEPGYVQFGAYFNNGVFSDGHIGWEHANFEIDDAFDPSWH